MPYNSVNELPDNVRNVLPSHAQAIFKEAFNNAYEQYKASKDRRGAESQEETAFRVAWSAVKKSYEKGDDGNWHAKK